jgi:hypothetical protein
VNESTRTSLLLSRLRKRNPDWLVWKISGQMTGGMPDALVVGPRGHCWIEFKNVTPGQDPHTKLTELQRRTLGRLDVLGQNVLVVGLLPDGEQAIFTYQSTFVDREVSKTALETELETWC